MLSASGARVISRMPFKLAACIWLGMLPLALGCSWQSPPPTSRADEIRGITVTLDTQIGATEPGMVYVEQPDKVEEFVRAWGSLKTVRPPSEPRSPEARMTVLVFLKRGGVWELRWNPGNGEDSFWLTGDKTEVTLPRSPMKVESRELRELALRWLEQ